jgi:CRP/FNR family transcriptional regulator, anaerobic regulatory protein
MSTTTLPTPPQAPAAAAPAGGSLTEMLQMLRQTLPMQRRLVHAGDVVVQSGQRFEWLHVLNSGMFKLVALTADGRERISGLYFKGDWLGFDGIASGHHTCDAVAMDTGELWSVRYDVLLDAATSCPALVAALHAAMSREITRDRESMMALCTLPADARVAEFLRQWTQALEHRGQRTDQLRMSMTRAEIGNHLGLTLETVSRVLSRLERAAIIRFGERSRRELHIAEPRALARFVEASLARTAPALQ